MNLLDTVTVTVSVVTGVQVEPSHFCFPALGHYDHQIHLQIIKPFSPHTSGLFQPIPKLESTWTTVLMTSKNV